MNRVLLITHLFPLPWDPARGVFNQQQFDRLSREVDLTVLAAIPWTMALRRPGSAYRALRWGDPRWPYARWFVSLHLPLFGRSFNAIAFALSLLLGRPGMLMRPWDCIVGSWLFPDAVAATAIGWMRSIPVLAKAHGSDANVYTRTALRRMQIRWALRRCEAVMCPSAQLADRLSEIGIPRDRLHVVRNGVDTNLMVRVDRAEARARLGLPDDAPLVLFVGNLIPTKGCLELAAAFRLLAAQRRDVRLALVGSGILADRLGDDFRDSGLSDRVIFAGKRPHAELHLWYSAADVLTLPSHAEGMPNVVLEALACGLPVVATPVGGVPDVVNEMVGRLVPVSTPEALRNAIAEVLDDPPRIDAVRARVTSITWEDNVRYVKELIVAADVSHGPPCSEQCR